MLQSDGESEKILAIELFNAAQALEFRRPLKSSAQIEEFVESERWFLLLKRMRLCTPYS